MKDTYCKKTPVAILCALVLLVSAQLQAAEMRGPASAPDRSWPEGAGTLVDLPRMNRVELTELVSDLMLSLETDQGYQEAS